MMIEAKPGDIIRCTFNMWVSSTPPGEVHNCGLRVKEGEFIEEEEGLIKILPTGSKFPLLVGIPVEWLDNIVIVSPASSNPNPLHDRLKGDKAMVPGFLLTFAKSTEQS